MNTLNKKWICLATLLVPYSFLAIYLISALFSKELSTFTPLAFMTMLPFSLLALTLKKIWNVKLEDGTLKGDLLLLMFGTLAFIGIFSGFFYWMFVITLKE
ncbi:MAG: hypothetical protein U0U67_16880 [Chitinophagales bacterium]